MPIAFCRKVAKLILRFISGNWNFSFFSCPPPNLVSGSSRRIWNPESESKPERSSRFWRRHGQWNWRAKFWNSESSQLDLCQSCWRKQSDRRSHEHECLKSRNRTQINILRKYYSETEQFKFQDVANKQLKLWAWMFEVQKQNRLLESINKTQFTFKMKKANKPLK